MYPIRTNRPIWCKPFLKEHICTSVCNTQYQIEESLIRIVYETGCLFPEKIEPVYVHIGNGIGEAYIDDIVLIPKTVNLLINFPMKTTHVQSVTFDQEQIRMSDILKKFDEIYKIIYQEEDEKSTKKEHEIEIECDQCDDSTYEEQNIHSFIQEILNDSSHTCNICYEDSSIEKLFNLKQCGHIFHKTCILKWFNTPKVVDEDQPPMKSNSCPSCRQCIIYCNKCKGNRSIHTIYHGAVPPYSENNISSRILTDGPYQIHSLYYEELFFKGFEYDCFKNTIRLLPFEDVNEEDEI